MASAEDITVVAVVAAYRPPADLVERIGKLSAQVAAVVVVDDGSPAGSEQVFNELATAGVRVIRQASNSGIAATLNAGVAVARQEFGAEAILTLDQDSDLGDEYVRSALNTLRAANQAGLRVGMVSAANYGGKAHTPIQPSRDGFVHAFDPMQSGLVIPVSTFDKIGYFDEELFIDGVDSEYTARAAAAGLAVLVGSGCKMTHSLGTREPASFFGLTVTWLSYDYHSAARVYYITRNGTVLTRRYWRKSTRWVLRRLRQETLAQLMRLVLGRGRGKNLRAMAAGYRDAFAGRLGPIRPQLAEKLQ